MIDIIAIDASPQHYQMQIKPRQLRRSLVRITKKKKHNFLKKK